MVTFNQHVAREREAMTAVIEYAGLNPAQVLTSEWESIDPAHVTITVVDEFGPPTVAIHRERVCLPDTPATAHQRCPENHHRAVTAQEARP